MSDTANKFTLLKAMMKDTYAGSKKKPKKEPKKK